MKNYFFIATAFILCAHALAFTYDSNNLRSDLEEASNIVIAKKVSGVLAYAYITEEIDSFQTAPIDWRNSDEWRKLQKRNSTESVFMVLNSIKGDLKVGDEFSFNDSYIPIELGSVNLYFLYKMESHIESNPCHQIRIDNHKSRIIELSNNSSELINYILKHKLSFCDE